MLGLLLRKVSSKAKSLYKIKKSHEVHLHAEELRRLKNICSNGLPLQLFKYQKCYVRNVASSILNTRLPVIIIPDKFRIVPNRQLNLVAYYQNIQPTRKIIISRDTGFYTHILCKRLSHQKIFSDARLLCCPNRKVHFKLIKRDSKENTQIQESDYEIPAEPEIPQAPEPQACTNYQEPARQECSQTSEYAYEQPHEYNYQYDAQDSQVDHQHLMQKTDPSYVEQQGKPETKSVECKKSSEDSKQCGAQAPTARTHDSGGKKLPKKRKATDTPSKSEYMKMNKLISYVRECGGSAIKKCKAETAKYMKLSKSRCAEIQHPDLLNVPQSLETRPDPPPPKSEHWSERMSKCQRRRRRCPCNKPETMVYVPYESSKSETRTQVPTPTNYSPTKYVTGSKCQARDDTHKFSWKTCMPTRRDGTPTSPHVKCVVSFEETDEKYAQLPSASASKKEKPFELDDVSDSKPNVSSLKYRLSKCPAVLKAWKICDRQKPETEIKTVKPSRGCFLPRRKKKKYYKGSGEWMKQTYPYRLKVFKSKDCLDPRPPAVVEMKRGDRHVVDEVKQPKMSPIHREMAKFVKSSCPKKYCSDVDIAKTKKRIMEAGRKKEKKLKRLKSFCRPRSTS